MSEASQTFNIRRDQLSLYLVTDNTSTILGDRDLVTVVEQAIDGGPEDRISTGPHDKSNFR